ncbi:hypothetical protein PpBr36_04357 [Pyricularia pennisetigena]|uniref:hypothetical protein n=1 Tax=Pyricularia pennisetigena TaxID=1578925 RepID=UPI00115255E2|nr:hypothetical protein PpBr36_04357 [Pyricularia pennisetigena]TLS26965.1 hypothetical protein PpBr36_04357 [Pyricularia pennisetigena]
MAPEKSSFDELVECLVDLGNKAYDPTVTATSKEDAKLQLNNFIENSSTVAIVPALNTLVRPGRVPEWLRLEFMRLLAAVPLRRYGVRATLEFIFAVHPLNESSSMEKKPDGAARGPTKISPEAMALASRLLSMPPSSIDPETWFAGIAPQLLDILDGRDGLDLTKVAAYVIGFGILGRRQFGAPGTSGWRSFAEPLHKTIKPGAHQVSSMQNSATEGGVVDLSKPSVLVSPSDLSIALRRLQHLVVHHPNPGLSRRLIQPLLLPLWAIVSGATDRDRYEEDYRRPAKNLLTIYLNVASSLDPVTCIIDNLLYSGERDKDRLLWIYDSQEDGTLQLVVPRQFDAGYLAVEKINLDQAEGKAQQLVDLISSAFTDEVISSIFLDVFNKWAKSNPDPQQPTILVKAEEKINDDPLQGLLRGQVLQTMMLKLQDKLASQPGHILKLVDDLLSDKAKLSHDEEVLSVALSLLNLIVTTPNFQQQKVDQELMESIESSLDRLSKMAVGESSTTAANIARYLKYRAAFDEPSEMQPSQTDRQIEERKTYALAVSYITQHDSPAPVRVEGLNLIHGLISTNSTILDIPAVLVLMSSLLAESDDYINLRVIKIYIELANRHPKSVTRELIDRYVDASEMAAVDTRLRFGEALMQVVERLGETFAGDAAQQVCHALLMLAGRRGRRPKTEAKQAREERLRKMKAERGELDDEPDKQDTAELSERQRADNAILNSIVEGWSSKRGAEDVRIRGSALSILAIGIETNIAGMGPDLVSSAVDLSMQVLALETEAEKGILRRSAVLIVLSFVRALDHAKEHKRHLGFGLTDESRADITRILEYVASTDTDGLVQQHARDVVESLENWRLSSLLPTDTGSSHPSDNSIRLAGLEIGLGNIQVSGNQTTQRAVIEEIE